MIGIACIYMQIQNLTLQNKLEKAGFNEKEAKVYVSLLELGGAYPTRIATYSGLNRSTVYKVLLNLSVRGLVNEIEKGKKLFYQIEKPEKILRFTTNQVKTAEDNLERAKEVVPEIEGLFGVLKNHPRVTYYEGVDGLLSIYEDMLNQKKPYEMLAFSRADKLESFFPMKFFKDFIHTKVEKRITTRGIIPDTAENRKYSERIFEGLPKEFWPKRKYIPTDKFMFSGEIVMYGDSKLALINFDKTNMTGLIVEDRGLHMAMRTIFELSWNSSIIKE